MSYLKSITEPRFRRVATDERVRSANAPNPLPSEMQRLLPFFQTIMDRANLYAADTVKKDKGGPFGAALFLVQQKKGIVVPVVNESGELFSSNAVISKGLASAHAEAENLSNKNKNKIRSFLQENRNSGWSVVQISTGESCPVCRAKQILFANELVGKKLITPGQFFVLFGSTYGQAFRDAGFNDQPYDQGYRALAAMGLAAPTGEGIERFETALLEDPAAELTLRNKDLIYVPVSLEKLNYERFSHYEDVYKLLFRSSPASFVLDSQTGAVIGSSAGEYALGVPACQPIIRAIQDAMIRRRKSGIFESWNLQGAHIITNIPEIGPLSWAEALWANAGKITRVQHESFYRDRAFKDLASECYESGKQSNQTFLRQVAGEYNDPESGSPLCVAYTGHPEDVSAAHAAWFAKMIAENVRNGLATKCDTPPGTLQGCEIRAISGAKIDLSLLFSNPAKATYSNYNGKNGNLTQRPTASPDPSMPAP